MSSIKCNGDQYQLWSSEAERLIYLESPYMLPVYYSSSTFYCLLSCIEPE